MLLAYVPDQAPTMPQEKPVSLVMSTMQKPLGHFSTHGATREQEASNVLKTMM
jgi:hypothetical protein